MQSLLLIALVVLAVTLQGVHGLVRGFMPPKRISIARPMFGGGKSKAAASITVNGKTIVASATPCNLRKELMANGVGALPFGNCKSHPLLLWQRGCRKLVTGCLLGTHLLTLLLSLTIALTLACPRRCISSQGQAYRQLRRGRYLRHMCGQSARWHEQHQPSFKE